MSLRISDHAIQQYCLRKYGDLTYYLTNTNVREELSNRLESARTSERNPNDFFMGKNKSVKSKNKKRRHVGIKSAEGVSFLEDEDYIYAIRENCLFTVMNIPGTDKVSDMIYSRSTRT